MIVSVKPIEMYLHQQMKLRLEEEYQVMEMDVTEEDEEAFLEDMTDESQRMADGYDTLL